MSCYGPGYFTVIHRGWCYTRNATKKPSSINEPLGHRKASEPEFCNVGGTLFLIPESQSAASVSLNKRSHCPFWAAVPAETASVGAVTPFVVALEAPI